VPANASAADKNNPLFANTAFTYADTASEKLPRKWALTSTAEVRKNGII